MTSLRLHQAAAANDVSTIRQRIREGAAIDARDAQGRTALLVATHGNHVDAARALIEAGADVNANFSAGSGGKQRSFNPNVTTYLVGESGYDLQANWGGSLYTPNDTLNNPAISGGY